MAWPSAQTVLIQAALELGLIQSSSDWGDDAYASTDGTVAQFRALLKKAGRDLVDESDWTQLRQEFAVLTPVKAAAAAAGQSAWGAFALPSDWRDMVDQSGWNRTSRLPMQGGLSEQEWQFLSARAAGMTLNVLFRPMQGLMFLYPAANVAGGQEIAMAYKSAWWVQNTAWLSYAGLQWVPATAYNSGSIVGYSSTSPTRPFVAQFYRCVTPGTSGTVGPDPSYGTSPYIPRASGALVDGTCVWNYIGTEVASDNVAGLTSNPLGTINFSFGVTEIPSAGSDLLMFDEALLVAKLKYLWLDAKGFDSNSALREYSRALDRATCVNSSAPKLSLNGGRLVDPLIGAQSFPITGFGS